MQDDLKNIFDKYAQDNVWGDADSLSGGGSNLIQTATIRKEIPNLIKKYQIKNMVDAPCGDYFWMKEIQAILEKELDSYYGIDIVESLVAKNQQKFASKKTSFLNLDITSQNIPKVDLIFTRDCLVHLSFANIYNVIRNYRKSNSTYLLTTTFTRTSPNRDIIDGDWRTLNLELAPFFFPKPIVLINENCTEGEGNYADKCLGLWEIKSLPSFSRLSIFINNRIMNKF
jgi:hypothetical protein